MVRLLIDKPGMYGIPAEQSMWCVTEYNAAEQIEQQSFWKTRADAVHHAKRLHKWLEKFGYHNHEVHVEEEMLSTRKDSVKMLLKGAEL